MKTAILIEDGLTQIVLTPETKFEKDAIRVVSENNSRVKILEGLFYQCRGGYVTHSTSQDLSLMLVFSKETPPSGGE